MYAPICNTPPSVNHRVGAKLRRVLPLLTLLVIIAAVGIANAGPGHDHGDNPPASTGMALPRFAAASELFELVGILDGKQLTVYLDHAATNAPVKDAKVELELDGKPVRLEPHGDGEFVATLSDPPNAGALAVSATVIAGNDSDLLAGTLDVHGAESAASEAHGHRWEEYLPWGLGTVAIAIVLTLLLKRRRQPQPAREGAGA